MATPTYNKKRGLWVIQGQKNGIRKTFYSSLSGQRGKREVLDKYDEWISFGGSSSVTVARCVELYLADIRSRLGEKDTFRETEIYTRLYVLPTLAKAKMNNLTLKDWQRVINEAKAVKTRSELSYKTLTHLRSVLTGLHRFAYVNYYCDEWRGSLYIPQGHKRGVREILQPSEIKRLFEPSDYWYHSAFLIMLLLGLRPSECLGLKESDIGNKVVYIQRGINDNGEITTGKNKNARRVVPLPPLAEEIIRDTIKRNHEANFETDWIFPNGVGNPSCQDTVRKQWNKLKAERNLHGSLYSLRHTFISIVSSQTHLAEGTIKDLVGHSKDFQTFDVYKHRVDGEIENAGRIINLTFERLKAENQ